jgi:hypothetical protein
MALGTDSGYGGVGAAPHGRRTLVRLVNLALD